MSRGSFARQLSTADSTGGDSAINKRTSIDKRNSLRLSCRSSKRLSINDAFVLGILDDDKEDFDFDLDEDEDEDEGDKQETSIAVKKNQDTSEKWHEEFTSAFEPDEMRCLALVAHNHMKESMKKFVMSHKELLKKFRLTGTNTTMTMLRETFSDDEDVEFGPTCTSGPLGGDAQLCSLMVLEDVGGIFFFMDPLSAHPHQADIESLVRMSNVANVLLCPNPTSAHGMTFVLEKALISGRKDLIPSFFYTLESPGVKVYKEQQKKVVEKAVASGDEKPEHIDLGSLLY